MADRIKHERIPLKRRARVYTGKPEEPSFEMFCLSRDLSISGIFLNTECLLRAGTEIKIDLEVHPEAWLVLNGQITRRIEFGDREHAPGFAVEFGELSDRSHETLLRYFLTDKVVAFYQIFLKRFPHLKDEMTEQDAALIVNLWEDNRHQLVAENQNAPITAPPRIFELPKRPAAIARPTAVSRPSPARPTIPRPGSTPVKAPPVKELPVKAPPAKMPVSKPAPAKAVPVAATSSAAKKKSKSK